MPISKADILQRVHIGAMAGHWHMRLPNHQPIIEAAPCCLPCYLTGGDGLSANFLLTDARISAHLTSGKGLSANCLMSPASLMRKKPRQERARPPVASARRKASNCQSSAVDSRRSIC